MPVPRPRPATLVDVARAAGVSVPTASRVLNPGVRGQVSVKPELRSRVLASAEQLGYAPSVAAQATKGGRARTIALLVSNIDNIGSAQLIAGFMHAAEDQGASLAVRATHDDAARELQLLTELRGERHRVVVVATSRTTEPEREAAFGARLQVLHDDGTRVVVIGTDALPFPSVVVDTAAAAATLARGLVDAGHRRFALAAGPRDQVTSQDRVRGFLAGLRERGVEVPEEHVVHEEFSREGGVAAAERLLPAIDGVDVVAAMSDAMTAGLIAQLRTHGVHVPRDVTVTGFDHIPMLSDVLEDFSTVEIPFAEFGTAALGLALDESPEPRRLVALHATTILAGRRLDP